MSEVNNIPEGDALSLPKGWVETTLGEVTKYINRGIPPVYSETNGITVLNQRCIRDNVVSFNNSRLHDIQMRNVAPEKIIQNGDVLICSTGVGTLGRVAQIRNIEVPTTVDSHVTIVRASKINFVFLGYFLRSKEREIEHLAEGSTGQTELPRNKVESFSISFPEDHAEQKSIAAILTSFDDKIELLQAQNKTLEETAQTIFKEWFGKYKIGDELPEGWREGKLSEIAEFLNGLALQKYPAILGQNSLPVIKIRELKQGITSNTDRANKELDSKYIVENGDVLFSWSGSLEVVIWQYGQGALNQHLFKVTSNKYPKWFYYYWTLEHLSEFRGIASDKATTMGHINRNHLDMAKVLIPNKGDFERLNGLFVPVLEKLETNYSQIQSLTQTRDELLPKLMSGEIRVKM